MDSVIFIIFICVLIFLVFLSALFSFSEMAISSSNKTRLLMITESDKYSKRKQKKASKVIHFVENYNEHITAIVIFNNIVNILFSTLATVFFTEIAEVTWGNPGAGALLSFAITTPLVIIFGEIIPKQLAKKYPESGTMLLTAAIICVNVIMKPITFVLGKIIKEEDNAALMSDDEINMAISQATEAGVTTEYEQTLIKKLLSADEQFVEDIMIPLKEVETIPEDITPDKLEAIVKMKSHTRFPVVNKDNQVVSVFSSRYYIIDLLNDELKDFSEYNYSFTTFNYDENPFHILEYLKSKREKLAIIEDDDHEFIGIITLEDIVELLVGGIYDESDIEEDGIYKLNDTSFILEGRVKLSYWISEENISVEVPEEDLNLSISKWVKKIKGSKVEIGDTLTYSNLIIWPKEDTTKRKSIVYEIDII